MYVASRTDANGDETSGTGGAYCADHDIPFTSGSDYGYSATVDAGVAYHNIDAPAVDLTGRTKQSVSDAFVDYFMFKPSGDSIFVPTATLSWGWSATAAIVNNQWNLSDSSPVEQTIATASTTFPEWGCQ